MGSKAKGKRFCFIIDRSASMAAGGAWDKVQSELVKTIRTHEDEAQFFVIFYGDDAVQHPNGMWSRRKKYVDNVIEWVKSIKPKGQTRPLKALKPSRRS